MFVLAMLLMFGILGLAVDLGWAYYMKHRAQAAAEAAATAGTLAAMSTSMVCGTSVVCQTSSVCSATTPYNNVVTACLYGEANGFGGTHANTNLYVASGTGAPPTVSGISPAFYTTAVAVTQYYGLFSSIKGYAKMTVAARATAAISETVPSQCLYVLDTTAQNALVVNNGATVTANCGMSVNSNNSDAVTVQGATLKPSAMTIVGGDVVNNGGVLSPSPVTGAAAVADPFANLPAPSGGACAYTGYTSASGSVTMNPGVYCNGISIGNGATVTWNPGTYYIEGGTLSLQGGTTNTGSGVFFYLTGNSTYPYGGVNIANGVNVTFSAETSGTYQGVLFYQDRSITSTTGAVFAGGASMSLSGTLYFPTTNVNYSNGTTATSTNTAIVADTISFAGGANFKYDSTGLKTGLLSKGVALVE
jgi:hypothetical protein